MQANYSQALSLSVPTSRDECKFARNLTRRRRSRDAGRSRRRRLKVGLRPSFEKYDEREFQMIQVFSRTIYYERSNIERRFPLLKRVITSQKRSTKIMAL